MERTAGSEQDPPPSRAEEGPVLHPAYRFGAAQNPQDRKVGETTAECFDFTVLRTGWLRLFPLFVVIAPLSILFQNWREGALPPTWPVGGVAFNLAIAILIARSQSRPPYELIVDDDAIVHRPTARMRWWNRPIFGTEHSGLWRAEWKAIEDVRKLEATVDGRPNFVLALRVDGRRRTIVLDARSVSAVREPERLLRIFRGKGWDV